MGTVLRTGEDCVGLATVLPLHFFDKLACVKQIARHWLSKADEGTKKSLKAALSDAQTGIIISERVVNAPPQLGAPLMAGLAQELALCKQRKDDAELQVYGKLKQFLVCAKVYEDKGVSANQSGAVPLLRNSQMATADAKVRAALRSVLPVCDRACNRARGLRDVRVRRWGAACVRLHVTVHGLLPPSPVLLLHVLLTVEAMHSVQRLLCM